ncbi:MAG TPA: hypothetical protein VJH95_04120, partial [Candidatus Nanoarchaeia archaeon]|nr:hypothetical protein [Candidatus Nanoarchaeia archaeon]
QETKQQLQQNRKEKLSQLKTMAKEEKLVVIKDHLTKTADILIGVANQVKSKAETSERLTETEAQSIISEMNDRIAKLEESKANVLAATTLEEVKSASEYIRRNTGEIRRNIMAHIARLRQGQPSAETTTSTTTTLIPQFVIVDQSETTTTLAEATTTTIAETTTTLAETTTTLETTTSSTTLETTTTLGGAQ